MIMSPIHAYLSLSVRRCSVVFGEDCVSSFTPLPVTSSTFLHGALPIIGRYTLFGAKKCSHLFMIATSFPSLPLTANVSVMVTITVKNL